MNCQLHNDLSILFSQLTPWVQALVVIGACTSVACIAYAVRESFATLVHYLAASITMRRPPA